MNNRPQNASVNSQEEINVIKIGDRVRSFDHEFKPFSWVVGTVVGFEEVQGCTRCVIELEKWETCRDNDGFHDHVVEVENSHTPGDLVYPPANGTRLAMGNKTYSNFVEVYEVA
jgi:hypothetical protein